MFDSLADKLTTLFSKHFVLSAFLPIFSFTALNAVLFRLEFDALPAWLVTFTSDPSAKETALLVLALVFAALLLRSFSGILRLTTEGRAWLPAPVAARLRRSHLGALEDTHRDYTLAAARSREIDAAKEGWKDELKAANARRTVSAGSAPRSARPATEEMRRKRIGAEPPSAADLAAAVRELSAALERGEPGAEAEWRDLLVAFDLALDEWRAQEVGIAVRRETRFGRGVVAPTAFGNVGESIRSYAFTRYGLHLDTFWSRLEPTLQAKPEFYGILQDAKAQLDLFVAGTWLFALTTAVWLLVLGLGGKSVPLFLAVVVGGPLATAVSYRAAVEAYVTFGESVRAALDLHRFSLLDSLHIARPSSLREERATWETLGRVISFGQLGIEIGYVHEPGDGP